MPPITAQARPALKFLPQAFNLHIWRGVKFLLPFWLKYQLAIATFESANIETLAQHYQDVQQGKSRILIAFRHPSTADPFTMAYLMWYLLPRTAKKAGIKLKAPVHSHFLYDRGVALWAGNIVNWLFPKLGGSSIFRGKADREGLRAARQILSESCFPLSIAPEGGTNEHSELISPLEPGVAQLGFWCQEDLIKANRTESVWIIPLSIRYQYLNPPWEQLSTLMDHIERDVGVSPRSAQPSGLIADPRADYLYGRLLHVGAEFLTQVESFYEQNYQKNFNNPTLQAPEAADAIANHPSAVDLLTENAQIVTRLQNGLNQVLEVSESFFNLKPKGNLMDRCRKLEQAAWDRMFLEHIDQLSPVERGLANWNAAEASLRLGHMRLAERLICLTQTYIIEKPSADRFAEVFLLLWRISTWLKGESSNKTPNLGKRKAIIEVCKPISISDRWSEYAKNRSSARNMVQSVTQDLHRTLASVVQAHSEEP